MNAIKFQTTVDDEVAQALPRLRPLLGRRIELIALDGLTSQPSRRRLSLEEFLEHQLVRPDDVEPVTLEDMEQAIQLLLVDRT